MAKQESLRNFFALMWQAPNPPVVKRIEVSAPLQRELTDLFGSQAAAFLDGEPKQVQFDGRYQIDESEIYVIQPFSLPSQVVQAVKNKHQLEKLDPEKDDLSDIKSVFASSQGASTTSLTLEFQAFDRSHLLGYKFSILGHKGIFRKLEETGLTLDTKLAALFDTDTLFFRSPFNIRKFVDIIDYYNLATDQEITDILSHPSIAIGEEGKEGVSRIATAWYRKRFTAIKESSVLDNHTPLVISNRAKKFGFKVEIDKGRIVLPKDKATARNLVKLLAEEFFEGVFTGKPYQTNSIKEIRDSSFRDGHMI